jgi:excinuclease ABC subunit A
VPREHNLQGVDASIFRVGLLACVTGVSGSGKSSTLVHDVPSATAAARKLNGGEWSCRAGTVQGHKGRIRAFRRQAVVDGSGAPIGRSAAVEPRVAYVKACWTRLREVVRRDCTLAKVRKATRRRRFQFQRARRALRALPRVEGQMTLEMQFLADAELTPCPKIVAGRCGSTSEIARGALKYTGQSIRRGAGDMTVRGGLVVVPRRAAQLTDQAGEALDAVGLGYLRLGQSATTLSGGEAQRDQARHLDLSTA